MEEIPLEYVEKAIKWLADKPQVNPNKIIVMGASRNAELALVIASTLPELVSGVIAFAPSSICWPNAVLPFNSDSLKPSWTYQSQDIPFLPMEKIKGIDSPMLETLPYWLAGIKRAAEFPEAIIPVEKIAGPILLLSGEDDKIWPSAMMSDMIAARLDSNNFSHDFENLQFEDAGHLISRDMAHITTDRTGQMYVEGKSYEIEFGGSIEGDRAAIIQSREKIFSFLQKYQTTQP